jgi:ribonuclease R
MTETQITRLLKNQQLSHQALVEKVEAVTAQQNDELDKILSHLQATGIVGIHNKFYYLLKDQGVFLAKVIVKTRNFAILKAIPSGTEVRISGEESDQLLLGDLVYAKEFQQNTFHCLDYYQAVSSLKGRYSLTKSGKEQLLVSYLNDAGKTVLITEKPENLTIHQGDFLVGDITSFEGNTITVKITQKLVSAEDVGADISMIIAENDGRIEFPSQVVDEAKKIPESLTQEDYEGRTDFREHTIVTIDGDDAHDFDDAVEIKRLGNGYEVTVHIADVTYYVRPNHPLDDEAIKRGTSIYVADRVVPMLPFELSNGICSLNPEVDRLTLSVTMDVDALGNVFFSKVEKGVIRSHGRLTYHQVNDFFNGLDVNLSKEICESLTLMHECSKIIRRRRTLQGAMKLDSVELKYQLDENGMPTDVVKQVQGEAEMMIEDLMIIANCSVARMLKNAKVPVLYRVHEFPPLQKLSILKDYLRRMDLLKEFPRTENISGGRLNDFLASIKDDNLRSAVSYMVLRSMAKARYTPEELGHFGLSEWDYCHFTSPIRRYPDDIIHRLVKDYLIDHKEFEYNDLLSYLENMGETMSDLESKADSIQREVDDLEAAKYMTQHIGELYHGKVVGMVQRGMFVQTDLGIEGFLAYHCMHGDYFKYNEKAFAVFGKMTDISFSIGTKIDIKVLAANPDKEEVDFATPEFYDQYALDLSEAERESLSLNGIKVVDEDDYEMMTGKPRFSHRDDEDYGDRTMNNEEMNEYEDDNLSAALESMENTEEEIQAKRKAREEDDFRPSPEQWKEVDVIRAILAKYPDDEQKVIEVLSVMDISEEEYRKLLRFTKPREDKRGGRRGSGKSFGGRGGKDSGDRHSSRGGFGGSRGGFRGGRDSGDRHSSRGGSYGAGSRMSNRSERRDGHSSGFDRKPARKSFSDHQGYSSSSYGEKRSSGFHKDSDRRERKPSYGTKGSSRGGYGRNKRD